MYNIKDICPADKQDGKSYKQIKSGVEELFFDSIHQASGNLYRTLDTLWLLPETPRREELRKKVGDLVSELHKIIHEDVATYRKEEFEVK